MRRLIATTTLAALVSITGGAASAQASGPPAGRGAPEPVAQVVTCQAVDLDIRFGAVEGTAGTTYREVVLTNRGLHACVLRGFPGVSYVDANGNQVGSAAVRVGDPGPLLTLPHGASATSDVGFAQVDNFDPDVCRKTPVWGIRVYSPDETVPLYLPLADQHGCAGDVSPFGNQLTATSVRG